MNQNIAPPQYSVYGHSIMRGTTGQATQGRGKWGGGVFVLPFVSERTTEKMKGSLGACPRLAIVTRLCWFEPDFLIV